MSDVDIEDLQELSAERRRQQLRQIDEFSCVAMCIWIACIFFFAYGCYKLTDTPRNMDYFYLVGVSGIVLILGVIICIVVTSYSCCSCDSCKKCDGSNFRSSY
jgi:hypothetical protein